MTVQCESDESCAPGGGCQPVTAEDEHGNDVEIGKYCRCCLEPTAPTCWEPGEDRGGCFTYPTP